MKKLSKSIKSIYGIGFMAKGIKDGLFQVFLFFFYNQVLGLDPFVTGLALTIALVFDSVTDPLVGAWSDGYKSKKWGRRHPFMFASAIPLGICLYLLFLPPTSFGDTGLFLWLTIFSILVRLALTLFIVPSMSLGAEMSTDYEERTSITTYRITFATIISPVLIFIGFTTFFSSNSEYTNGMFRAESYPKFALFAGIMATMTILLSTYFTKSVIPHISQGDAKEGNTFKSTLQAIKEALSLTSFKSLILYILILYIAIGIGIIFSPYYVTYFFTLTEEQFALILLSPAPAGLLTFFIAPFIGKLWNKKKILIVTSILTGFFFSLPYNLRILGIFPENGTEYLFPYFFILTTLGYMFLWIAMSTSHSMMADIVDEFELKFGSRKEGIFFSSLSLAYKATVGLGSFFAGILLKIIDFPDQTKVEDVAHDAIMGLGYVGGPLVFFIYLISVIYIFFYPISKKRYEVIRQELANK